MTGQALPTACIGISLAVLLAACRGGASSTAPPASTPSPAVPMDFTEVLDFARRAAAAYQDEPAIRAVAGNFFTEPRAESFLLILRRARAARTLGHEMAAIAKIEALAAPAAAGDAMIGRKLLHRDRESCEGGMAVVSRHDPRLHRFVALKILPAERSGDATRRPASSARRARRRALNHPTS
jgi:hypothetical protein